MKSDPKLHFQKKKKKKLHCMFGFVHCPCRVLFLGSACVSDPSPFPESPKLSWAWHCLQCQSLQACLLSYNVLSNLYMDCRGCLSFNKYAINGFIFFGFLYLKCKKVIHLLHGWRISLLPTAMPGHFFYGSLLLPQEPQ